MSFYMHAHTPSNATYEYAEHVHARTHTHASVHANTLAASAGRLEQKQPPHTECPHAQTQPLKNTRIHTNRVHTAALLLSSPAAILINEQRRSDACS